MLFRQITPIVIVVLLAFNFSAIAGQVNEDVFGLRWKSSRDEITKSGIALTKYNSEKNISVYKATSLPKPLSDAMAYMLFFDNEKLVKVSMVGETITDDLLGTKGKKRFETIKQILKNKYGKPTSNTQKTGNVVYEEEDEFYECLAYDGCGLWLTSFKTPTKSFFLRLLGTGRGTGYIALQIELQPDWDKAVGSLESSKNTDDARGL